MELRDGELVNRYDNPLLSEYYSEIVECLPEYLELRNIVATLIKERHLPNETVLDVGSGRGDSARPILEAIKDISIDLLDVSPELLGEADKFLGQYKGRYQIFLEDALVYLNRCLPYRTIYSEFTVHNFYQEDKEKLFEAIYNKLTLEGNFILLDKIQHNDPDVVQELSDAQNERYRERLEPHVAEAIIAHERDDMGEEVRMKEGKTIEKLRKIGFREVTIIQRIKRDVVIRATK